MRGNANLVCLGALLLSASGCGDDHSENTPKPAATHIDAGTLGTDDAGASSTPTDVLDAEAPSSSEPTPPNDAAAPSGSADASVEPPASGTDATDPAPTGSGPAPAECEGSVEPGTSPLRRLSRVEYGNTLFQLFGDINYQRLGIDHLVADGEALGFSNQAAVLSTSPLLAAQYMDIATTVAEEHADDFDSALSSCVEDSASQACAGELEAWIGSFGQKVYRRPLSNDEQAEYASIYDWEVAERGVHREGVKRVLETLLQSPHFLYRPEFGGAENVDGDVVQLSSWEMATRLSYLFWNTMPDVGLFEAAAADELRTPKQIEQAARRLLKAPRARLAFRNFHSEWLNLQEILNTRHNGKDPTLFPDYDDSIPPELFEETLQFLDYTVFEGEGNLQSLLTAPYTRLNQHSAAFYGIEGPSSDEFETVELDPERYSGFLTQPGLLMAHATRELSSPIHRGLFIRTNLLCQPPPPPPPNIPPPPKVDRSKTTREQYAAHSDNPTCAACHQLMDPIGLGFEHFDALGRYRETEWDKPIDATGVIYQYDGEEWIPEADFDGVVELGAALAASERVKTCVARQWFRFAMGRGEAEQDACSMQQIDANFSANEYDIQELVLAITKTPSFRYIHRKAEQ